MNQPLQIISLLTVFALFCCTTEVDSSPNETNLEEESSMLKSSAAITNVSASGEENNYTFSVTIASPDTGCEQYADWWEVIDLDGNLIHRRILAHSHVNEQPFSRSGSGITISSTIEVYIRAHMNNTSYGANAMRGSVANGFTTTDLSIDFAKELETQAPLPNGCAF